jgi:hypothetical protein
VLFVGEKDWKSYQTLIMPPVLTGVRMTNQMLGLYLSEVMSVTFTGIMKTG